MRVRSFLKASHFTWATVACPVCDFAPGSMAISYAALRNWGGLSFCLELLCPYGHGFYVPVCNCCGYPAVDSPAYIRPKQAEVVHRVLFSPGPIPINALRSARLRGIAVFHGNAHVTFKHVERG